MSPGEGETRPFTPSGMFSVVLTSHILAKALYHFQCEIKELQRGGMSRVVF